MKQKDLDVSKQDKNHTLAEQGTAIKSDSLAVESENASEKSADQAQQGPSDSELQNIIEAALFAAKEPLGVRKITALFNEEGQPSKVDIQNVIIALQEQCETRGIELRRIGAGWRFQSKEKYSPWLRKLSASKAPKYSRALLETLSIIAYRQPVTRGDIEEIRGVGVSSDTIRTLEERDWVAQIGHRDVPGRPALFGTTQGFLEYFNMASLRDLPELLDKRELGEIAKDMNMTLPMDRVQDDDEAAKAKSDASQQTELKVDAPENSESEALMAKQASSQQGIDHNSDETLSTANQDEPNER